MKKKAYIPLLILLIGSLFFNIFLYQSHNAKQDLFQQNLNQRLLSELSFFSSKLEEGKVPNTSVLSSASRIDILSYYSDLEVNTSLAEIIAEKIDNNQPLKNVGKVQEKIIDIQDDPDQEKILELNNFLKK
ncbi:hypothetical protein J45TS6_32160 [Paenibacillus sp. J45TS6]|uniref:Uncharacterized protein n=1 Tax=Paenibacillus gallinarum TaxID=2762232 RepID=A0ABR8T6H7_9BACL|nr:MULTISPECIES: hypothetical protein [Paenibacillus]MBD7971375.1 hypothetical protein [Paenibacillus gallinarum]GIP44757.1 hypothetical protein J45TS6_32160 [Paenibacillus sp. J45TS6]